MALFPISSNAVLLSSASAATDEYRNGVKLNATGTLLRAATSGGTQWSNGLLMTNSGQVVYVDATSGLPDPVYVVNGIPVDEDGAMCVSTDAYATYCNGLPMAANGAIAAGIIP